MSRLDLQSLLTRVRESVAERALAERAIRLVDLTSLRGDETRDEIAALCRRAVDHGTAAVCIYPTHLATARGVLAGSGVRLATVANFPGGSDNIGLAAEETAAAVAAGADEVDVVAPIEAIMEGDLGLVGEMVQAVREAAGPGSTLKLILETGVLETPERITGAARAAVMAGVDFLKTSTGKAAVGATLEAAAALLTVCAEADGQVGFKAAGGVRTANEAAAYLALAEAILGPDWATPATFRFGASGLLDDLLRVTGQGGSAPAAGGY